VNVLLIRDPADPEVMRRAPRPIAEPPISEVTWLNLDNALDKLDYYPLHLTWINAFESMRNSQNLEGLHVTLPNGSSGWLVYRMVNIKELEG
jgi:hypothetical protein